jgi:hypothetical protein
MSVPGARNFDLNIEKILEGWEVRHAVREVIANALDEQALSNTRDISIATDASGNWHIRDFCPGYSQPPKSRGADPVRAL